jgi:hypothetical protein
MTKRRKPKRKGKAGRPGERLVIRDPEAALAKLLKKPPKP